MKRAVALLMVVVLAAGVVWWWARSAPEPQMAPAEQDAGAEPATASAEAPESYRGPASGPDETAARTTDDAEDDVQPLTTAGIRAQCTPERRTVVLPSSVVESVENLLGASDPVDRTEAEGQMTQCLELRDLVEQHELPLYDRDDGGELSRIRQAIGRCWELWYLQPDTSDERDQVARSEVMEEILGRAAPLVQAQDHEGLLEMTDELAAMDAPMTVYDDWDPPVDLPYVLALRADAPIEHFTALAESGVAPSPRALSRLATYRRVDVLEALREAGVDITATDIAGNDVVHGAVQSGDAQTVRAVAALGVDFDRLSMHPNPQQWPRIASGDEAAAEDGLTALLERQPDIAAEVLRAGYRVGPRHLQDILMRAPKDIADAVYLALRADGCA